MGNVLVDARHMTDMAEALRERLKSEERFYPSRMPDAVRRIPRADDFAEIMEKPIRFFDYDGTPLFGCSAEELSLTESLPELPEHEGLIREGWNWTREELIAHGRAMDVGACYITDDGATRVHVETDALTLRAWVTFGQDADRGIVIDWGDGTPTESFDGSDPEQPVTAGHVYAEPGRRIVRLIPQGDANLYLYGSRGTGSGLWHGNFDGYEENALHHKCVKKIELGRRIGGMGDYALAELFRLESLSVTETARGWGENLLNSAVSLPFLVLPRTVTRIPEGLCQKCARLEGISMPAGVTEIASYAFDGCQSLRRAEMPNGVANLERYAFSTCPSLRSVRLPDGITVGKSSVFSQCPGIGEIHLPGGLREIQSDMMSGLCCVGEITIPEGVTKIGAMAFSTNLYHIYMKPVNPPQLFLFMNMPILYTDYLIHVPKGSLESYRAADGWKRHADRIVETEDS